MVCQEWLKMRLPKWPIWAYRRCLNITARQLGGAWNVAISGCARDLPGGGMRCLQPGRGLASPVSQPRSDHVGALGADVLMFHPNSPATARMSGRRTRPP